MVSVPAGRLVVEKLALPPALTPLVAAVPSNVTVPRVVDPLWKVTVPVGAAPALSVDKLTVMLTEVPAITYRSGWNDGALRLVGA